MSSLVVIGFVVMDDYVPVQKVFREWEESEEWASTFDNVVALIGDVEVTVLDEFRRFEAVDKAESLARLEGFDLPLGWDVAPDGDWPAFVDNDFPFYRVQVWEAEFLFSGGGSHVLRGWYSPSVSVGESLQLFASSALPVLEGVVGVDGVELSVVEDLFFNTRWLQELQV